MGDIPDWLAQLAADDDESPEELRRDVNESADDAMPDMSASLEEILGFDNTPSVQPESEALIFDEAPSDDDRTVVDSDGDSSPLFTSEPFIFEDEAPEEDTAQQDALVFDDLRTQADTALPADLAEKESGMLDKFNLSLAGVGLKGWQALVLVVFLFLDVAVIGFMILVMAGFIQI